MNVSNRKAVYDDGERQRTHGVQRNVVARVVAHHILHLCSHVLSGVCRVVSCCVVCRVCHVVCRVVPCVVMLTLSAIHFRRLSAVRRTRQTKRRSSTGETSTKLCPPTGRFSSQVSYTWHNSFSFLSLLLLTCQLHYSTTTTPRTDHRQRQRHDPAR